MNIWVTGTNGQVGRVLLDLLKKRGIPAFGTTHAEVDIADEKAVRQQMQKATHVINPAAYAQVDPAETEREASFRANVSGPEMLAKAAREFGTRLVHISTDYVFDGKSNRPYREEDETNPLNWYGYTKREGEIRALNAYPETCIVRVSWVFGGHGARHYVAQVLRLVSQNKTLRFVDDQIGRPTYALDFAEALIALRDCQGIYHYSNSGSLSKYAFARAIWEWAQQKSLPTICEQIVPIPSVEFPTPAKRPLFTSFDTSKVEKLISIRPWREALTDCMNRL
ncbi:MAG: dTDP-4-dehydrorhamnose reductase [Verrucomicrobia bacterium]|nr:dTDP-4-dehydrorhamnose reductase [Verrucomicrobiota bacterium]